MRGKPAAYTEVGREDSARGQTQRIDDLAIIQHGQSARLADLVAKILQRSLRISPIGQRVEVGQPEPERPGPQAEVATLGGAVLQRDQGREDASRGRPIQAGKVRRLSQRMASPRLTQCFDDREAACDRPHEFVAVLAHPSPRSFALPWIVEYPK